MSIAQNVGKGIYDNGHYISCASYCKLNSWHTVADIDFAKLSSREAAETINYLLTKNEE